MSIKKFAPLLLIIFIIFISISVIFAINSKFFKTFTFLNIPKTEVVKITKPVNDVIKSFVKTQKKVYISISKNIKKTKAGKDFSFVLTGIGLAYLYGLLHSIGPGHGKIIIASYLMSEQFQLWKIPILALQVAATHTLSAIAWVFIADISLRQVLTSSIDKVFWIKIVSYSLITLVGILLIFKKIIGKFFREKFQNISQGLVVLGAGIVPCTGALLIMLFAMANDLTIVGIALVLFVGLGIATTLTTVGYITVFSKEQIKKENKLLRGKNVYKALEHAGSFAVFVLGLGLLLLTIYS